MSSSCRPLPFMLDGLRKEAEQRGVAFHADLDYGHVAQLRFPDGSVRYVLRNVLDVNRIASSMLAGLKSRSLRMLQAAGIPVPEFGVFSAYPPASAGAETGPAAFALRLGYPVVLRPDGRADGKGVRVVARPDALIGAIGEVVKTDPSFLVQRLVLGRAYRVCVFDGRIVVAYEQASLTLTGDPVVGSDICEVDDDLSRSALDVARQAAHLSGLRFAAIDGILPAAGGGEPPFYVLKVDGFCDLEEFAALGERPARMVADLIHAIFDDLAGYDSSAAANGEGSKRGSFSAPLPDLTTVADRIRDLAPAAGIRVESAPDLDCALRLTYPGGTVRHVVEELTDVNRTGSVLVARQKPWSLRFLQEADFHVPEFECFYADWLAEILGSGRNEAAALRCAQRLGFPVVAKPNGRLGGQGVFIAASPDDFVRFCPFLLAEDPIFMVQRAVFGIEYRVVVLDGEVQIVFEKHALTLSGDGRRTIEVLLAERLARVAAYNEHAPPTADDFRIESYLAFLGRSRQDVPGAGERIRVMLNAGYGCGGDLIEAEDTIPPAVAKAAIEVTRHAGLRYSGIDIKGPERPGSTPYHVIEVNSMPDLTGYAALGPAQRQKVEVLLERLLVAMGRS